MIHTSIELHDSKLLDVAVTGETLVLTLAAYVHRWENTVSAWVGTGWVQRAELRIMALASPVSIESSTLDIDGGCLVLDLTQYDGIFPAPLDSPGTVHLTIDLKCAGPLQYIGRGFSAVLIGLPRYVEPLPQEWAPEADAT